MNCPNCGAQMRPGPIRGRKRCADCDTIVDQRPREKAAGAAAGPFALLQNRDGDGVPDFFQACSSMTRTQVRTSYEINGQRYESLDEVPEQFRKLFRAVGPLVETEAHAVDAGPAAETTVELQRGEHAVSHASWSPRELERAGVGPPAAGPAWLKPFVLGLLAALVLGWLLFG